MRNNAEQWDGGAGLDEEQPTGREYPTAIAADGAALWRLIIGANEIPGLRILPMVSSRWHNGRSGSLKGIDRQP